MFIIRNILFSFLTCIVSITILTILFTYKNMANAFPVENNMEQRTPNIRLDNKAIEVKVINRKIKLEIISNIQKYAQAYEIPIPLILAVIKIESNFNIKSISKKGAKGLMQLMPCTAHEYRVFNLYDPEQNIRGGTAYLRDLINRYQNLSLALAGYNAGPGNVDKYGKIPPYPETINFVRQVLYWYREYRKITNFSSSELSNIYDTSISLTSKNSSDYHTGSNPDNVGDKKLNKYLKSALNLEKEGKTQQAIVEFRRLINLYPNDIEPYLELSSLYQQKNNNLKSIHILKMFLQNNKQYARKNDVKRRIVDLTRLYR